MWFGERVHVLPENREWLHTPLSQSRLGSCTPDQTSQVQLELEDKHIVATLGLNMLNTIYVKSYVKSLSMVTNIQCKQGIHRRLHNMKEWPGMKKHIFRIPFSVKIRMPSHNIKENAAELTLWPIRIKHSAVQWYNSSH